jgi:hypothetical protein
MTTIKVVTDVHSWLAQKSHTHNIVISLVRSMKCVAQYFHAFFWSYIFIKTSISCILQKMWLILSLSATEFQQEYKSFEGKITTKSTHGPLHIRLRKENHPLHIYIVQASLMIVQAPMVVSTLRFSGMWKCQR